MPVFVYEDDNEEGQKGFKGSGGRQYQDAIAINGYVNVRACVHRVGKAYEQTVHGVVAILVLSWTTHATLSPAWVI